MKPATRLRLRPDRFLGISTHSHPKVDVGEELTEDDILWTGEFAQSVSESNHIHTSRHSQPKGFRLYAKSGILAVLPEQDRSPGLSVFNHKAASVPTVSPSSVSSARMMITVAPKKPSAPDRRNFSTVHGHSVPVSVPMLSEPMRRWRDSREFDNIEDVIEEGENGSSSEILPPHKLVKAKETPALANSVLEGIGRTLKGRDLRQVRNAIWRKTGFIDYEYGKRGWE